MPPTTRSESRPRPALPPETAPLCADATAVPSRDGCVHERCYTTLLFRPQNQTTMARRSYELDEFMLGLWVRRLRGSTMLPIVVMHANMPSVRARRLLNATANRVQLQRVGLVVVEPPGTFAWYREQYTKLHAWSLPCRQVTYLDYDGIIVRNMDSIFDECGSAPFCAVADTMTPINPKYRGNYFNGGVLVLRPNTSTHERLLSDADVDARGKRARWYAEQGFLNVHYRSWKHLPTAYNVMGASLDRGRPRENWRAHPETDFFVHEKAYKLGPVQRRLLGLGGETFPNVDRKGQLVQPTTSPERVGTRVNE
tara:strand:- start:575 stop:1507 length:933 start_codon:yes stop_codon:yes gene_type:complete